MRRVNFPFDFYNPHIDQQLDPVDVEKIIADSPIPIELHHTVHQAKALIGEMTIDDLIAIDNQFDELCAQAIDLRFGFSRTITARDVYYSDDAERLRLTLSKGKHSIPPSEWSRYMGVFALRFAGLIHCQVWPTQEYLKIQSGNNGPDRHIDLKLLRDRATTAARAAAYGIAFRDFNEHREINRKNAAKAHKDKHAIIEQFIDWSLTLPNNLSFSITAKAATYFKEHVLTAEQRKEASAASFHETLGKGLKKYCFEKGIPYPFKKNTP